MTEEQLPSSEKQPIDNVSLRLEKNKYKKVFIVVGVIVALAIVAYGLLSKNNKQELSQVEGFFTLGTIGRSDIPAEKLQQYQERMSFAKANTVNPDGEINFRSYMDAASVKKGVGDYEGARDIWEYMNVKRPKNSVSFANLGDLYANFLKDPAKAESNYLKAIENDPTDPGYVRNLLELYENHVQSKLGFSDAIFLKAAEANPSNVEFWLLLARYYELSKNYEKAIGTLDRVLEIDQSKQEFVAEEQVRIKNLNK